MTLIYLIRHGENEYVEKGKLAGWLPEIHLNDRGIVQAEALVKVFSNRKLNAIYSSPLERTLETAKPLAESMDLKVIKTERLGEIGYGRWQGQSLKALRRRKLWPIIQNTPSLARFPEGESFVEAQARVVSKIEDLRSKHKRKKSAIACVTHADVIKLIVAHYIGLPLDLYQRLTVLPGSVSTLHLGPSIRLLALNDTTATRSTLEE